MKHALWHLIACVTPVEVVPPFHPRYWSALFRLVHFHFRRVANGLLPLGTMTKHAGVEISARNDAYPLVMCDRTRPSWRLACIIVPLWFAPAREKHEVQCSSRARQSTVQASTAATPCATNLAKDLKHEGLTYRVAGPS